MWQDNTVVIMCLQTYCLSHLSPDGAPLAINIFNMPHRGVRINSIHQMAYIILKVRVCRNVWHAHARSHVSSLFWFVAPSAVWLQARIRATCIGIVSWLRESLNTWFIIGQTINEGCVIIARDFWAQHLVAMVPLEWRHNGLDSVSNPASRLFTQSFIQTQIKENIKVPRHWPEGNSPGTGEFPAQMASKAENVSIWWRHHDFDFIWLTRTKHLWLWLTFVVASRPKCYHLSSNYQFSWNDDSIMDTGINIHPMSINSRYMYPEVRVFWGCVVCHLAGQAIEQILYSFSRCFLA